MFLDGQLRALADKRRAIALRGELSRRLARLEASLGRAAFSRSLNNLTLGLGIARWFVARIRGR
ncbi:hypothetical protein [Desulfovibrio sp. TomC]|uniref:hypothetical protein n=1 Tax=Desulfovibrio sp. TomC TaxID=1562888 RepID=UPI0005731A29|nr:hypothetical protein [Desulfovibrio sp. TomC]KHK00572.1 hypothetical protein NY78_4040 [Desulfovibrio sp. TomC]